MGETSNRCIFYYEFEQGGFTVNTSPVAFTAVGVDQAQEHLNKDHKGDGGISGITNYPDVLLRYCLSTPGLTRLSHETEAMLGVRSPGRKQHHLLSEATVAHRERYIRQVKDVLSKVNPFKVPECTDGTELKLIHLTNKMIMPDSVQQNILDTEKRGETAYKSFVEERICGNKNLWDKMTKVKVEGWSSVTKSVKTKLSSMEITIKASSSMMAHLLVITRSSRDIDLKHVIGKYEFSTINHMLMTADGKLHPCLDKAQLIHKMTNQLQLDDPVTDQSDQLEADDSDSHPPNQQPEQLEPDGPITNQEPELVIPTDTCIIFDGMAVVQEQVVFKDAIKNCEDLANHVVHAINRKSHGYASTYVVFDNYSVVSSLKDSTRKRHTKGKSSYVPDYKVDDNTHVKDFSTFLKQKTY
jgi:hypothetical protein